MRKLCRCEILFVYYLFLNIQILAVSGQNDSAVIELDHNSKQNLNELVNIKKSIPHRIAKRDVLNSEMDNSSSTNFTKKLKGPIPDQVASILVQQPVNEQVSFKNGSNTKLSEFSSKQNVTFSETEPNLYYSTSVLEDPAVNHFYWVNLSNIPDFKVNKFLSNSYRKTSPVKLSFKFPFYGHVIENITVATGGFIFTGDYVHSWLAATEYIAPLMANFDTSISNNSFIKYYDNGTAFTVEWEKVKLQDQSEEGEFTFQVTLFNNGDIVFVYKKVPLLIDHIQNSKHPIKIGLSDAFSLNRTMFNTFRRTLYEYDRLKIKGTYIKDWTTIILKALPTCLDAPDCNSCLSKQLKYDCFWCPTINKCSKGGYDRGRQNWLNHKCDLNSFKNASLCEFNVTK